MAEDEPVAVIRAIRAEIDAAADAILSATEGGLCDIASARQGDGQALDRLYLKLSTILEACAFHDLTSQRLSVLARLTASGAQTAPTGPIDPLLYGPALLGSGLDQAMADQLFSAPLSNS